MKRIKPLLFFITILGCVFIITANVANFDFDLWARLIAGMGVLDGGHVLKEDFLSYTPVHTWWDHEYGSGVVFYFFLKYFGAYSLIFLQAALFFFIFFIIYKITKIRGVKQPFSLIFYFFSLMALSSNFGSPIRCHLFSFLLFAIFLCILELARKGNIKLLYLLPLLTILWNNLHGGVVSGLGLIALYVLGQILDKKPFKHFIISGMLSSVVLIINPWGWEYIKFLLMANTMERTHVAEWWGLFSKHQFANQIPFKVFMLIILLLEAFKLRVDGLKTDKTKYIVLFVTLFLAIEHVKLLPFFVISASAFCYEDFESILSEKFPRWCENFVTILLLFVCATSFAVKKFDIPLGASVYPHKEVEFIKINKLKGNILVNFGLGSFVSYKLYPQNLIYMDGRYEEVYYDEMVPLLEKFYLLKPGWDEVLKKYPPDILIIEKYYPVYVMLNNHKDWKNIFDAESFAVFVKRENVKKNYILPSNDIQYYKDTLFDTSIKF